MKINSTQNVKIELTEEEFFIILAMTGEAIPSKIEKLVLDTYNHKVDGLRVHDMYSVLEDFYDNKIKEWLRYN